MKYLLLIGCVVLVSGCSSHSLEEREMTLADVPDEFLEAARTAVPGFVPSEAEIEHIVELEGTSGGLIFEIEVNDDGEVIKVEQKTD